MMDQAVINFTVHEDETEFRGIAKVTLPNLEYLTQTVSGSGIAGNIEAVMAGLVDSMTASIDFRSTNADTIKLATPERHNITLRYAMQYEDTVNATVDTRGLKHVLSVIPKGFKAGVIQPATANDASGEYAVRSWTTYDNGKKILEIDPMNYRFYMNGRDYLDKVRKALGK